MPAPLLLADLPWLLYRSFFALPASIRGTGGRALNALLGTVNALLAAEQALAGGGGVRAIVACMGAEEAAYRTALYPPYHAHREPMPQALREQWGAARGLIESFGWGYEESGELEADDVMFSLARIESEAGGRALLLSADRDLYGAVSNTVAVLELRKGGGVSEIGVAGVRERYGVEPGQVADFIALRGDPSDGIPGAPGIGAKTAAALLREHATLEALIELAQGEPAKAAHALRPGVRAALADNADQLLTFKRVATLQWIELARPPDTRTDRARGAQAAKALGMNALARRLAGGSERAREGSQPPLGGPAARA